MTVDGRWSTADLVAIAAMAEASGSSGAAVVAPDASRGRPLPEGWQASVAEVAERTGTRLLAGARCAILAEGVPALDDWTLAPLDFVWARVLAGTSTEAVLRGIEHPHLRGLSWTRACEGLEREPLIARLVRRAVVVEVTADGIGETALADVLAAGLTVCASSEATAVAELGRLEAAQARVPASQLASADRLLGQRRLRLARKRAREASRR